MLEIPQMLRSAATETALIELTSRCNLRCVYCAVSQPGYQGVDLDLSCIDEVLDTLEDRRVKLININGHGETTLIKEWSDVCVRMLNRGLRLGIVSNFARRLEDTEVEVFSRFEQVCVSCDTVDPELFTALRRKAKLSVLLENMSRIQEQCRKANIAGPRFSWSVVVSDKTVMDLERLADKGMQVGVKHFEFCNLTKYPDVPNAITVRHISTLSMEEMLEARRCIKAAMKRIDSAGCTWSIQSGLLDVLDQRLDSKAAGDTAPAEPVTRYSVDAATGMTRMCLDPWKLVYIHADGTIRTCCWHWDGMGNLKQGDTLAEAVNNEKMQELRHQLLTGELSKYCGNCPARALTSIENLKSAVRQLLEEQAAVSSGPIQRWRQLRRLQKTITLPLLSISKTVRRWRT
jgi:MoaA/NifB/PqqE/SkfB family radical SAM enzyme